MAFRKGWSLRIDMIKMSFDRCKKEDTIDQLKFWTMRDLHELLDDKYEFTIDQQKTILDAYQEVCEDQYKHLEDTKAILEELDVNRRGEVLKNMSVSEEPLDDGKYLQSLTEYVRLFEKQRKMFPREEWRNILIQDADMNHFYKKLYPSMKKTCLLK